VYQLEGPLDPNTVLTASYLGREQFTTQLVQVGRRRGYLVRGSIVSERPKWADVVGTWIADSSLMGTIGNTTAAAVLLLPTREADSGIVWGL
jgi:hypothetical protein